MNMERFVGKVAVVTGASAGIGLAILKELADRGMIVVGMARRKDILENLADKSNGKIHAIRCDMCKEEDVVGAFKLIDAKLGRIDVLVNNAGVLEYTSTSEGSTELWKRQLDLNILGLSIATREALKIMKRTDDGVIININSVMGHQVYPMPGSGMYTATKYATRALGQSLRIELRAANSGIKVTNLSPGLVHTQLAVDVAKKAYNRDMPTVGQERPKDSLASEDVAQAVVSVLSMEPWVQIEELTINAVDKQKSKI